MKKREMAECIGKLLVHQARVALLGVLFEVAASEELTMESLEEILQMAQEWPTQEGK